MTTTRVRGKSSASLTRSMLGSCERCFEQRPLLPLSQFNHAKDCHHRRHHHHYNHHEWQDHKLVDFCIKNNQNCNQQRRPCRPGQEPKKKPHVSQRTPATKTIKLTNLSSPTRTTKTKPKSFITRALFYQIVIISLILYEPPASASYSSYFPSSSSPSSLVEASLHSLGQQQQQQQHNGAQSVNEREIDPHHDNHQLKRRHLAAAAAAATSAQNQHHDHMQQKRGSAKQQHEVECHRLAAMWLYLHSNYPTLAGRLLEWASLASGRQSDEQFLWARTPNKASSIGHLLEEAERLMSAGGGASGKSSEQRQQHNRQLTSAAWLARVSSNPAYAKLVQHLRAKQQQHWPSSASTSPSPSPSSSSSSRGGSSTGSDGNGNGPSHQADQLATAASGSVYGRLVHFPHEIGSTDNSRGMARTLDKLRLLNHHNRQQQQQWQAEQEGVEQQQRLNAAGGVGATLAAADRDIEETNRIPLAVAAAPSAFQTDIDQMTESDWRKLSESATDAARQNFVYGKVLLRPSQSEATAHHNHHHHHHQQHLQQQDQEQQRAGGHFHQRPLETLHELAYEQERQRLAALEKGQPSPPVGELASKTTTQDSFGRVLEGPQVSLTMANDAAANAAGAPAATAYDDDDKSAQKQHTKQAQRQPTDDSDELMKQLRFQQAAAMDEAGAASETAGGGSSTNDEEFQGDFHQGPLNQPEVRLLRSLDPKQRPENHLAGTGKTVSSKGNNMFVID